MLSPKCIIYIVFFNFLVSEMTLVIRVDGLKVIRTNEFLLRFEKTLLSAVKTELSKVNITYVKQVIPNVFLFKDDGSTSEMPDILQNNEKLKGKVSGFQRVQELIAELWTKSTKRTENDPVMNDDNKKSGVSTFFDMGVEGAWRQNYTGKGILIAVTDVGVNKDLKDIQPNIDTDASYNAVDPERITDFAPEEFDDHPDTMFTTDHGNRCAGIIAALRNGICGDGVAYEGKIAALKIFKVMYDSTDVRHPHGEIDYQYPIIASGIYHAMHKVDIYSNSWETTEIFVRGTTRQDFVIDAIKSSATLGRGGKGAVHVFPAGTVSNPFANSIYTIAVSSVGQNGKVPKYSSVCACTLTAAYGQGCDIGTNPDCDTSHTLTTSRGGCTQEFYGSSASTAIVSGILALALQANPNLGWRDVQDIVVRASERNKNMAEHNHFLKNGAGKYYHPVLGFGLLNATTLVTLARHMQPLPQQVTITEASQFGKSTSSQKSVEVYVTIPCNDTLCVRSLEHVVAMVSFRTQRVEYCELILISPASTSSLLMDRLQANDTGPGRYENVEFLSVHFWGEKAVGKWTLVLKQSGNFAPETFEILEFNLSVFGTGVDTTATEVSAPKDMSTAMILSLSIVPVILVLIAFILLCHCKHLKGICQMRYSPMKDDNMWTRP